MNEGADRMYVAPMPRDSPGVMVRVFHAGSQGHTDFFGCMDVGACPSPAKAGANSDRVLIVARCTRDGVTLAAQSETSEDMLRERGPKWFADDCVAALAKGFRRTPEQLGPVTIDRALE